MRSTHETFQNVAPTTFLENTASRGIDGYVFCTTPADVTQFCSKECKCYGTCEGKMANSSSHFYSTFLYNNH